MEVNQVHEDLKELYAGKDIKRNLGVKFEDENEIARIINLFKMGYWSLMPFAFETYNNYAI